MTSLAFAVVPTRRTAPELGSAEWFLALSLLAFASLPSLHLLQMHGTVAPHWIHCAAFVAVAGLMATIVIRSRRHSHKQKHHAVDVPRGGAWSPDLPAPDTAKPHIVAGIEDPDQPWVLTRLAAERQTGLTLGQLRVQHQLRDPVHHARMIVRDLESHNGAADELERVRSLRVHIDEIAHTIEGRDVRASVAARWADVSRSSQEERS